MLVITTVSAVVVMGLAFCVGVVPASADVADAAEVPYDIQTYFQQKVPAAMQEDLKIPDPNIKSIQKTYVVSVDDSGKVSIEPSDSWAAAVYDTERPVGAVEVVRDKNGKPSTRGFSKDDAIARYLVTAEESKSQLVKAEQLGDAFFLRANGELTPLNTAAYHIFTKKTSEAKALAAFQKKFNELKTTGGGSTVAEPVTWKWLWVVVVLALVILMSSGIYVATGKRKGFTHQ
ncbi:MAG: hypothetical protein LKI93_00255 [Bifidobacteriaceae bacterium]|jgi:hypothetical protein|nr:hypothetical protein [Bifidobacteriaceae bacterium]